MQKTAQNTADNKKKDLMLKSGKGHTKAKRSKRYILSRNFKEPKMCKKWLRSHYSHSIRKLPENTFNIKKYEKSQKWLTYGKMARNGLFWD